MGLMIHAHPDHVSAEAGPVTPADKRKLAKAHADVVANIKASFPQLAVSTNVSADELTRGFTVHGVSEDTRMTVYAAAHAGHQRIEGAGIEWGGAS